MSPNTAALLRTYLEANYVRFIVSQQLILRRFLDAIDHEDVHRAFRRLQLEPELFLQRGDGAARRGRETDPRRRSPVGEDDQEACAATQGGEHAQMIGEGLNHLWQSTIFAAVAWLLTIAFRQNRAHVRYWLWFSASVKFFVPFALLINLGSRLPWAPAAQSIAEQGIAVTIVQISQPFPGAWP